MKFSKSSTLRRLINSSSFSLRSRGCKMLMINSLCGHVMHPAVVSSVTKAWLGSMQSNKWMPLKFSLWLRASSSGKTLPESAGISAMPTHNVILFCLVGVEGLNVRIKDVWNESDAMISVVTQVNAQTMNQSIIQIYLSPCINKIQYKVMTINTHGNWLPEKPTETDKNSYRQRCCSWPWDVLEDKFWVLGLGQPGPWPCKTRDLSD